MLVRTQTVIVHFQTKSFKIFVFFYNISACENPVLFIIESYCVTLPIIGIYGTFTLDFGFLWGILLLSYSSVRRLGM